MTEQHTLMGGTLHVYKRPNSRHWQCSTYLKGKNWRSSTKEESLSHAKDIAEDWYLDLKGKHRAGELKTGKTFRVAAEQFLKEFEVITEGQRSSDCLAKYEEKLNLHLLPFFGSMIVSEIKPGTVQEYRVHRATSRKDKHGNPKRPSRSTMHKEIVTLRQVLKTAQRHGWLEFIPDLSSPYKTSGKVEHRAWFSPVEYRQLYMATRQRAKKATQKVLEVGV
jgi:hypothetical protein